MSHTIHRRGRRTRSTLFRAVALLAAVAGVATMVPIGSAGAAPIDDLRAQAAELDAKMIEVGAKLGALHEQIMYQQEKIDSAKRTAAEAEAGISTAQAYVDAITSLVRARAATVYRHAGLNGVGEFDTDIREQASRRRYANAASQRDDQLLAQLAQAKDDLAARRAAADKDRADVERQQETLKVQEAEFAGQKAELARIQAGVKGEIAQLVAEEQARRQAAAASAAASARPVAGVSTGGTRFDPSKVPPSSGAAGIAVAYALAQLGKPYCNDGNRKGPDCYDCSGLTQQAWAAAGVSIGGSSGSQYAALPKVPMDQLQPGDLVFFPNPGAHVGLYVGGGSVVSASVPGDFVKYHSISLYASAARPG